MGVMLIDFMDNSTVMGEHIDTDIFEPEAWRVYYEYQFKRSPLLCRIIRSEGGIYGDDIVALGVKHCADADRDRKAGVPIPEVKLLVPPLNQ